MATRQTTLLLKRSNVIGKIPPLSGLTLGEMALNTADAKLYTLFTSGTTGATEVREIGWNRVSKTGDTISGDLIINGGLSATTISAATYQNLPVSGLTPGNNIAISGNNGNFTISVTGATGGGYYLPLSGGTVTGTTYFTQGLSANTISATTYNFDTTNTATPLFGQMNWNVDFGVPQIGMFGGNVVQKVGETIFAYVKNVDTVTLNKGDVVYLYGASGDKISVQRASNTGDTTSSKTLGVVSETIGVNQLGYVITQGTIDGLSLGSYNPGDVVWLSDVPGQFTKTKQYAPNHLVFIGVVQRANNGNGQLYVKPQNGYELDELHNVAVTGATMGDLLSYSPSNGNRLWVNTKTLNGSYTITGNTSIGGNLVVSGNTSLQGLTATTTNINGNLTVTGNTSLQSFTGTSGTINGNLTVTGNTSLQSFTGTSGTINGNLTVTGNTSLKGLTATTISAATYQNLPAASLTVGSSQIVSGTDGRILFQSGTTLQQSSNLFWDNTIGRLTANGANGILTPRVDVGDGFLISGGTNILRYAGTASIKHRFTNNGTTAYFEIDPANSIVWTPMNMAVGVSTGTAGARLDVRALGESTSDLAFRILSSGGTRNMVECNSVGGFFLRRFTNNGLMSLDHNGRISIGYNSSITNHQVNDLSIGYNASIVSGSGGNRVVIGPSASSSLSYNVVIGLNSSANSNGAVVIGWGASSSGGDATNPQVAIGSNMRTSATNSVMIGGNYSSTQTNNIANSFMLHLSNIATSGNTQHFFVNSNTNLVLRSGTALTAATNFDSTATNTLTIHTGTTPTTNIANAFQLYSAAVTPGNAAPHFRTENGSTIRLYQNSAVTTTQGVADALTNLGVLSASTIVPTVQSVVSATTVTPAFTNDLVTITAQAGALTLAAPTGTTINGKDLMIRIKDNGTARAITWTSGAGGYRAIGVTLPTTTVANKTTYVGLIYNSDDSRWDAIGVTTEA